MVTLSQRGHGPDWSGYSGQDRPPFTFTSASMTLINIFATTYSRFFLISVIIYIYLNACSVSTEKGSKREGAKTEVLQKEIPVVLILIT